MAKKKQVTIAHCNGCIGQRDHEILHSELVPWQEAFEGVEDEDQPEGCDTYEMLRCRGCGHITFRVISWTSFDLDDNEQPIASEAYYPPPLLRRMPNWGVVHHKGDEYDVVRSLLLEIHVAIRHRCPRLAAMGVRALIEQIMIYNVGDQKSFGKNLQEFHNKGFLNSRAKCNFELGER